MKEVDVIIGNSSSGVIEAPSLKKPTVNIGERQRGRVRASSVIDCKPFQKDIYVSINLALSDNFKNISASTANPYEKSGTSDNIFNIIVKANLQNILQKHFFDLVSFNDI